MSIPAIGYKARRATTRSTVSFSERDTEEVGAVSWKLQIVPKEIEGNNEEIAALIEPRDGRQTMSVPASERDSRNRARGGRRASCGRTTPLYASISPALMRQEVSPRPLVEPYDEGRSIKGVRPTSPLVLLPTCARGSPDSRQAPELASWYWLESRCCICCMHACVPLVMPGVWVASVAGRRTEARGARLHVGAIASTRLMIPGSMWRAGAQIQTAQLLSAFASAWRLDARSWRGGAFGC